MGNGMMPLEQLQQQQQQQRQSMFDEAEGGQYAPSNRTHSLSTTYPLEEPEHHQQPLKGTSMQPQPVLRSWEHQPVAYRQQSDLLHLFGVYTETGCLIYHDI